MPSLRMLVGGAFLLICGLYFVLAAEHAFQRSWSRWRKRRSQIDDGAPEAFFEERRSLDAYPPAKSVWSFRLLGCLMVPLGFYFLYMSGQG